MSKLLSATALALALAAAAPALAQSGQARGGEALAQTQAPQTQTPQAQTPQAQTPTTGVQAGSSATTTAPAASDAWYGRFSADDLIGKDIVNTKGDEVGEIEDIVVDPSSRSMYAVVSVGGFLGIGDKDIALSFDQLKLGSDDAILMSEQSETQLKQLPAYDKARYRAVERGAPLTPAKN